MAQFTCKVDNQGRITLPIEWRRAHAIEAGSDVSVLLAGDCLEVQTVTQSIDEACRMAAKYRKGKSALELLQEDRQQENRREASLEKSHG